ncbi:MAG: hypothetical protein ISS56_05520 [Anaerolineae bacterium]|nr:hypothetical protein [Anaerolineae bacterium]
METFTGIRAFVDHPDYRTHRQAALNSLDMETIDAPIVPIIEGMATLPYCFTLQSCYGHFLYGDQREPRNVERLPALIHVSDIEYRLAYIALCVENSRSGVTFLRDLGGIPRIDPEYVQFGCAEWFWERQVNSYVLQVEPARSATKDRINVGYGEALHLQKVRDAFWNELCLLVQHRLAIR